MNILEQNKEKINGILETFDRMCCASILFKVLQKSLNVLRYSLIRKELLWQIYMNNL